MIAYRQDAVKKVFGAKMYPGLTRTYVVRRGLSFVEKKQVALAIFQEVSLGFEAKQDSWIARKLTGTDSGFSEEDLVSDLIAFYKTVYPMIDVDALCKPVSTEASRAVWNANGPVGQNKNKTAPANIGAGRSSRSRDSLGRQPEVRVPRQKEPDRLSDS